MGSPHQVLRRTDGPVDRAPHGAWAPLAGREARRRRSGAAASGEARLAEAMEALPLTDVERRYVRARWLDQLNWMGAKADSAQRLYYGLRLATVVGAVAVPAVVSINVGGDTNQVVRWLAFGLGLLVAVCASIEQLFGFGERWQGFRTGEERLKAEGWSFYELTGPYRRFRDHSSACKAFVSRVESVIRRDVEYFMTEVAATPGEQEKDEDKE